MNWMKFTRFPLGLVLSLLLVSAMACSGSDSFKGTVLEPADAAPSFQLEDQFGDSVALADMAGSVVVLTFLYTYCPDICPIVTETLRSTFTLLGDDTDQVEFVAISVDPQRDSVERAYQYSLEKGMEDRWRFLVGSEEELSPIWRDYWLDPVIDVPEDDHDSDGDGDHDGNANATGDSTTPYLVGHTAPVYLIDRDGFRRIVFTQLSLDPQSLVHDIRLLIK